MMSEMAIAAGAFRIGIDVGGTFTDLVAVDGEGEVVVVKTPSTPADQSVGVLNGLGALAGRVGLTLGELLSRTERIVHGTTVATNTLIERNGADVVLVTTKGHRDLVEMREGFKEQRYNLRLPPPDPLVARDRRLGISERLTAEGNIFTALSMDEVDTAIDLIRSTNTKSVAICFLHSYRNPIHEIEASKRIKDAVPGILVSCSHNVIPQIKEYDRFSTTVINSYVAPKVHRYLTNLVGLLKEASFQGELLIIFSHGGVAPVEEAVRLPAGTALSGPAGGVAAAVRIAETLRMPNLVPFDMGGTSTDISLISEGRAALSTEREVAGQKIALRSLDIASIGAGGGSIARPGPGKTLLVGPESAGADPGPACYGLGGREATVTDANLILGYLKPSALLSRDKMLDKAAAQAALSKIADELGLEVPQVAAGIYRVANLKMADGIRLMTVRRGVDPRKFTLLSFGGAAGIHAVEVARELEMTRVVVPTVASVLSAWGMLTSDLRYDLAQTHIGNESNLTDDLLRDSFTSLESTAKDNLKKWFKGPINAERTAEMRYGEQIYEIDVPLNGIDWSQSGLLENVKQAFHRRHEEIYTYSSSDQEVVLVNSRVSVTGETPRFPIKKIDTKSNFDDIGYRDAYFDDFIKTPVINMSSLGVGEKIKGPYILESETTSVVVGTGDVAHINEYGWIDILLRSS